MTVRFALNQIFLKWRHFFYTASCRSFVPCINRACWIVTIFSFPLLTQKLFKILSFFLFFPITDNAHAMFVRATYLVCHRLISSWKTDLNVSLAALELLSGLARLHIRDSGRLSLIYV